MGITPIMDYCREQYGREYEPNTRETFRRQTMHQFVEAGMALYNPDQPDRPVNSPKACYQISEEAYQVITTYGMIIGRRRLRSISKGKGRLLLSGRSIVRCRRFLSKSRRDRRSRLRRVLIAS